MNKQSKERFFLKKEKVRRPMKERENLKLNPPICSQLIFDKSTQNIQWIKDSLKQCWKSWISICRGTKLVPSHHIKKKKISLMWWYMSIIRKRYQYVEETSALSSSLPTLTNECMDKINVNAVYIHNRILFGYKKEWNPVIYSKLDDSGGHTVKWNKPGTKRQIFHFFSHVETRKLIL